MDGVIKQLVELEETAKKMIEDAKQNASKMRQETEQELKSVEKSRIIQTELDAKRIIEQAKVDGDTFYQEISTSAQMQVVQMEQKYEQIKEAVIKEVLETLFGSKEE